MAAHTISGTMLQDKSSVPDAGKNTSHDEPTASPTTNRSASKPEQSGEVLGDEVVDGSDVKRERSQDASLASKRCLPEPCTNEEEPESKNMKRSCTSLNGNAEPTPEISKETWQGFCEIESEPAYFATILRDMGVQGINVREVFAMEPWFLETLPQPTYGLILLYRYRDNGSSERPTEAPRPLWFANQLPAQNSCATLAMINIIMNSTDVEIGDHLQQFKDFTEDFTPYQRGEALASFDFVKKIHNSFAKRMDMLEADKHLSYKVKKAQRLLKDKKARRKSTDSAATDDSAEGYEDNAHHFIAYIPAGNEVWMLDGFNAQPTSVAQFDTERGETWLSLAAESILSIMADEGHEYTSFAITQSPLLPLREQACLAIDTIKHIELRLDHISRDWRSLATDEPSPPNLQMLGIEDQLSLHTVPDTVATAISNEEMPALVERRKQVFIDLDQLAADIASETQTEAEETQKAAQRRYDCGPVIKMWAEMLAGNGFLEGNLDGFMPSSSRDKKAKK
ncbi:ubiquitin-specific protease [Ascochyta rabiei]|uniref:ubiquitinyl hydrolase 1 n=2 Tax=Didymella rabiei TaxID=5454 RepID=A0A163CTP2_DIDRA|nr:ubiquitin-specific protease [Ascochyta rabiei]